jgi:DNA-binding transcriptional MocR family regulator
LRDRRDALVAAVREQLPSCRLDLIPAGGVHLWLRLPEHCSDGDVTEAAAARGLAVYPGRGCFPGEAPGPYLRLSFAGEEAPALRRAAQILAEVVGG